ncbi:MAG: hypothetical protein ORN98_09265 [Alphaproteobacteria bacterium]|nr:hypothetical protein [Alphaproteobacteria bacterium]
MTTATLLPTATPIDNNKSTNAAGAATNSVAASTAKAQAGIGQTYSQFLTLLTTQLKNQDPLSPMDSSQFTNQLVLFSQVEQQINANTTLGNIYTSLQQFQGMQAQNYIGDIVAVNSNSFNLNISDGGMQPVIGYKFDSAPAFVDIKIFNSAGNLVAQSTGGGGKTSGQYTWDGTNGAGVRYKDGSYTVKVTGTFTGGTQKAATNVTTSAEVTNVKVDPTNGVQLELDQNGWVPLANIASVIASQSQAASSQTNAHLNNLNANLADIKSSLTPAKTTPAATSSDSSPASAAANANSGN